MLLSVQSLPWVAKGMRTMLRTRFTDLVGCFKPIQMAGMSAAATPQLAAAVSEAGALGMIGAGRAGLTPLTLTALLDETRSLTQQPFGVNFLCDPGHSVDPRCYEIAAKAARVVEFFYGWPDPALVAQVHRGGALAFWQVGSRTEALAAEHAGCDAIVAQGTEAGGHLRGSIGLHALLGEVCRHVSVPVIAAGGIGTGRAVESALAAGADGVRVGTRLLAAAEAGIHPDYLAALIKAQAEDTVVTEAFSVGWPNAPHRVLRSCITAAASIASDIVGARKDLAGTTIPIPRFACVTADLSTTGAVAAMSLWAGESVSAIIRVQPAREIVDELMRGTSPRDGLSVCL